MLFNLVQGWHDLQIEAKQAIKCFEKILEETFYLTETRRREYLDSMRKPMDEAIDELRRKFDNQNKIDLTNNPDKQLEGRVKEAFKDAEKLLHKTSEGTLADMDKRLRDHLNFKLNKIWENFVTNADKIFEETMEGFRETTPGIQFLEVAPAPVVHLPPMQDINPDIAHVPVRLIACSSPCLHLFSTRHHVSPRMLDWTFVAWQNYWCIIH